MFKQQELDKLKTLPKLTITRREILMDQKQIPGQIFFKFEKHGFRPSYPP